VKSRFILLFSIFAFLPAFGFGQEQPFTFMMLTDPQFGMYTADKDFARETANYEFAVAAANRLKPGFVIVLGDLVNKEGNTAQIREFLRISWTIDSSIPVYYVAGNHDVGHEPTAESVAAYRKNFGADYYSFRAGPIYGIVLNSTLILAPQKVEAEYQAQDAWFRKELEKAKESGARHIVVFQHHPYFTKEANEPDQWGNFPLARRRPMLDLLHSYGIRHVFAGHVHSNILVKDGELEMTATGPVGMPFGADGSGIRIAFVTDSGIQHRYYGFDRLPDKLELKPQAPGR